MKTKKTYSLEKQIAIDVDMEAAKRQVSSSSIVQEAIKKFLDRQTDPINKRF